MANQAIEQMAAHRRR